MDAEVGEGGGRRLSLKAGQRGLVLPVKDDDESLGARAGRRAPAALQVDGAALDFLGEQLCHLDGVARDKAGRHGSILGLVEGVVGEPLEPLPLSPQLGVADRTDAQVVRRVENGGLSDEGAHQCSAGGAVTHERNDTVSFEWYDQRHLRDVRVQINELLSRSLAHGVVDDQWVGRVDLEFETARQRPDTRTYANFEEIRIRRTALPPSHA